MCGQWQGWTTLLVKKFTPIPNPNLPWWDLRLLPLVLLLAPSEHSPNSPGCTILSGSFGEWGGPPDPPFFQTKEPQLSQPIQTNDNSRDYFSLVLKSHFCDKNKMKSITERDLEREERLIISIFLKYIKNVCTIIPHPYVPKFYVPFLFWIAGTSFFYIYLQYSAQWSPILLHYHKCCWVAAVTHVNFLTLCWNIRMFNLAA